MDTAHFRSNILDCIPLEILHLIVSSLDACSLIQMSGTLRHFRTLVWSTDIHVFKIFEYTAMNTSRLLCARSVHGGSYVNWLECRHPTILHINGSVHLFTNPSTPTWNTGNTFFTEQVIYVHTHKLTVELFHYTAVDGTLIYESFTAIYNERSYYSKVDNIEVLFLTKKGIFSLCELNSSRFFSKPYVVSLLKAYF